MPDQIVVVENQIGDDFARVGVWYKGEYGDLPDPVPRDAGEGDVKQWLTEAIVAGDVPGIAADPNADLTDYALDRDPAKADRPYHMIGVRPKVPFG
jgi:hypothetical protein